ncbi:MAG: hypothetical protein Unbinned5784contig1000_42 [Prokaryotic dsDNA virus sp.]|nr:MAG: hypothetical protein Unbinned5784contig1000_42 [Prokaryotic dsDNA virus sp.]
MLSIDPMAVEALAGLSPMPRTPLTINPCPPGYNLQNVGGSLMCVLEGAEAIQPMPQGALAGYPGRRAPLPVMTRGGLGSTP